MPKKYIFYLVGLLLLAGLGYYGFSKWTEAREKVDLWTLVPDDAVFVIESGNHADMVDRLKRTQIWESLSEVTYLRRLEENLVLVDSLADNRETLFKFLGDKKVLSSVHVTGKSDFELVFYLPISTVKEHRYMRTLVENLEKNGQFEHTTDQYQGTTITSFRNQANRQSLSYFTYRNNLILSSSPALLEGIVRRIKRKQFVSVAADFKNINYLNQEKVYANVFINYRNLPPFLNLFVKPELQPDLEYLCGLSRNSMLEFRLENNKLFLNGFSNPETLSQTFFEHLSGQKPKPMALEQLVSNRVAFFMHFGLDKAARLRQYKGAKLPELLPEYKAQTDTLAQLFGGELGLAYLQTFNPNTSPEKVIFAQTSAPAHVLKRLNALALDINLLNKTVPYKEQKGSYVIRMVPVKDFPQRLFGRLFRGFGQCYFVDVQQYIVFADNPAALRSVLNDIEAGNVWGKSVAQKAFLEETQHETNFSVFLNSENAWPMLSRYVNTDKRESLLRNENLIKDFNQFSLQFSQVEKQYYTTILLRQQDALAIEDLQADTFEIEKTIPFRSKLIAGPFAVRSPLNRGLEMMVQDSGSVLHNVSYEGRITWSDTLNEAIKGEILQAPFGSDGKTKYLFATSHKIHCLDRNGKDVENFPYFLPDSLHLQRLTILDFNKNGDHKLLVDDELGNLFMFNETGDLLPGWEPRSLDSRLAVAPQYFRVGSKNVIVVVLENGLVYALDEAGETYPGFPFSVRASVRSGMFGKPGSNLQKSEMTLVTLRGEVITFNLAGEILKRHQLVRPDRNATFELIPENAGKSYLIARQSLGRVTLLSPDFKLLLERNFFTSSRKIVQYYLFGGDNVVYVITETGPQKTYLFDVKAQPIGNRVIENRSPVKLFYNDITREFQLYKIFGRELKKITLERKN
ncbi:hypothetical protein I5M27_03410 [Adhaeribacter sp. BT258]|uniref:Outer membrane protein assembly factor BamB, contains PQQ-like beta-propeller repeat n=1 Tax=Adhaeribacter terrigena TaxID=2793070 RepID=A0ABS1BY25_9BACT|nr:hypothetical protein [Adhaeribacter terrigena]MBK0402017.1 hypothetical protein [Adhaeribacter terrigena]